MRLLSNTGILREPRICLSNRYLLMTSSARKLIFFTDDEDAAYGDFYLLMDGGVLYIAKNYTQGPTSGAFSIKPPGSTKNYQLAEYFRSALPEGTPELASSEEHYRWVVDIIPPRKDLEGFPGIAWPLKFLGVYTKEETSEDTENEN